MDAVAVGIFGGVLAFNDLYAERSQPLFNFGAAPLHLVMDVETAAHVFLFSDLEAHHEFVAPRRPVDGVTRRVRPAMLQRLQHCGHFQTNVARPVAVDKSSDSAHFYFLSFPVVFSQALAWEKVARSAG